MKKNGLLVATILVVIVIAGVYRFNVTNDDIYVKQVDGQVVPYSESGDKVMLHLFSFNTDNRWLVDLPESEVKVALTEVDSNGPYPLAKGHYRDGEERGVIGLDYSKITPLNFTSDSDNMMFVAPFSVSNQGSGLFWYLGFFQLDIKKALVKQMDSLFIGDRVRIEHVKTDEPFDVSSSIVIGYLGHNDSQSMAEIPEKEVNRTIKVSTQGFSE